VKKPESDLTIQLNSLIKTKNILSREYIEEKWVGGFIIRRFISFSDLREDILIQILPYLDNIKLSPFGDKWEEYLYLYHILPKLDGVRFKYISKPKTKIDNKKQEKIDILMEALELQEKDIKYLIENNLIEIEL